MPTMELTSSRITTGLDVIYCCCMFCEHIGAYPWIHTYIYIYVYVHETIYPYSKTPGTPMAQTYIQLPSSRWFGLVVGRLEAGFLLILCRNRANPPNHQSKPPIEECLIQGSVQLNWQRLKIKEPGLRRFWSIFPLTRVPLWCRFFEPYPTHLLEKAPKVTGEPFRTLTEYVPKGLNN